LPYRYTVADALPWLAGGETSCGLSDGYQPKWRRNDESPTGPICAAEGLSHPTGLVTDDGALSESDQRTALRHAGRAIVDLGESSPTIQTNPRGWNAGKVVSPSRNAQVADKPAYTIQQHGRGWHPGVNGPVGPATQTGRAVRTFTIAELRRICGFPDDFELVGTRAQQWGRLGNAVMPPMYRALVCVGPAPGDWR
jgi:site-specific DNA-cytosine methylase